MIFKNLLRAFIILISFDYTFAMEAPKKEKTEIYCQELTNVQVPGFIKLITYANPDDKHTFKYKLKYLNAKKNSIGSCKFFYYDDTNKGTIDLLFISKKYQNKGCGSLLLQKALEILLTKNIRVIKTMASPDKDIPLERLIKFYTGAGFKVNKLRTGYAMMKYKPVRK